MLGNGETTTGVPICSPGLSRVVVTSDGLPDGGVLLRREAVSKARRETPRNPLQLEICCQK